LKIVERQSPTVALELSVASANPSGKSNNLLLNLCPLKASSTSAQPNQSLRLGAVHPFGNLFELRHAGLCREAIDFFY
jgi:hypothetical protein